MINFDYISDIHLDFYLKINKTNNKKMEIFIKKLLPKNRSSIIVVAGDISHFNSQTILFMEILLDYYHDVVFTFGNHDMYLINENQKLKYNNDSMNRIIELDNHFKEHKNIHFLNGGCIEINGVVFAGTGMSWDFDYGKNVHSISEYSQINSFRNYMNDSKYILMDGKPNITIPLAYGASHTEYSFDPEVFFKDEYCKLNNIEKADVVVTHYGPVVPEDLPEKYDNISSAFYYFNGKIIFNKMKPKIWIFGHTHDSYQFEFKDCVVASNPLGYPGENRGQLIKNIKV